MKYSLRSLMIVAILAPPLLAGLWSMGASAIARMRHDDQWEDAPGSIAEFPCVLRLVEPDLPNSSAPAPNPPNP